MQNNYNKETSFEVVYAGFFVRLAAFIIDSLIVGIVTLGIKVPVWCVALIFPNAFWNQGILFQFTMVDIFIYLLSVTYFILFTYCAGATLGKKVMNIQVVSTTGQELTMMQVIYRETVGRYLSMVLCNLGYLMVLVHKEKCSLHDVLADTQVIYGKRIKADTYRSGGEAAESFGAPTFVSPAMEGMSDSDELVVAEEQVVMDESEAMEEPVVSGSDGAEQTS